MDATQIEALLAPVVASHSLEIDRLEVVKAGGRAVVRVFLDGDGPQGRGPSLDEISAATRDISNTLDGADVNGGRPYTLEVSSRGATRPLTEPRHFRRNIGRLVELDLASGHLVGRLVGSGETGIELQCEAGPRSIEFDQIRRAVIKLELTRAEQEA